MKAADFVENIKNNRPEIFNQVGEKRTQALVRQVFAHLAEQIEHQPEGVLQVAGLGNFRVQELEKDIEGKKGKKETVRRVIFRPVVRNADPAESDKK